MRKYSVLGIQIIGPWPVDPLVICHAKINSNCIHKGKKKICLGRRKVCHFCITTTSQIIGAAAAAPAAALSTPLLVFKHEKRIFCTTFGYFALPLPLDSHPIIKSLHVLYGQAGERTHNLWTALAFTYLAI